MFQAVAFSDGNISQGNVSTRLTYGGMFYCFCQKFIAKYVDERILTIGWHFSKLDAKYSGTFFRTRCIGLHCTLS